MGHIVYSFNFISLIILKHIVRVLLLNTLNFFFSQILYILLQEKGESSSGIESLELVSVMILSQQIDTVSIRIWYINI